MSCRDKELKIKQLSDDLLEEEEADELLAHIVECDLCQSLFESYLREPWIEEAVEKMRQAVPSIQEEHEFLKQERMTPQKRAGIKHYFKRFRTVAAAAASIVIVFLWMTVNNEFDPNQAYASMISNLEEIKTARFEETNNYGVKTIHYQTEEGLWRSEVSNEGGYYSFGVFDGHSLAWTHPEKKFIDIQHNPYFPSLAPAPFWKEIRKKIDTLTGEREYLGEQEMEGKKLLGYRIALSDHGAFTQCTEIIWIYKETHLPVLVESRSVFSYASLSKERLEREKQRLARLVEIGRMTGEEAGNMIQSNMKPTEVVNTYCKFQWNAQLDPSLFIIIIHEGFTVQEIDRQPADSKELRAFGYTGKDTDR